MARKSYKGTIIVAMSILFCCSHLWAVTVDLGTIIIATQNNLSKIRDGQITAKGYTKTYLPSPSVNSIEYSYFEYNVSFIRGISGVDGPIRYDSHITSTMDGNPYPIAGGSVKKDYFDGEKLKEFWVEQNVAYVDADQLLKAHNSMIRRFHPLYYGFTLEGIPFEKFIKGEEGNCKIGSDATGRLTLEIIKNYNVSNTSTSAKFLLWMVPEKDFFIEKLQAFVQIDGNTWVPMNEVEIIPTLYGEVWIPLKIHRIVYKKTQDTDGKVTTTKFGEEEITFSDFRFNIGLQSSDLEFSLPQGTIFNDRLIGVSYKIK